MSQNTPRTSWLQGCGPLVIVGTVTVMSPYLAFSYLLRTQTHHRDEEQFYAARIGGNLRLPSERQIRVATEKPDWMAGGYYTVRFTLPATRTPEAWIREIGNLNSFLPEARDTPVPAHPGTVRGGAGTPASRSARKKWGWAFGSRSVAYKWTSGEYFATFRND